MGHASCDSTMRHQHSQDGSLQCQLCAKGITRAVILFEYSRQKMVPEPINLETNSFSRPGTRATYEVPMLERGHKSRTSQNKQWKHVGTPRKDDLGSCTVCRVALHTPPNRSPPLAAQDFTIPARRFRVFPRCFHGVSGLCGVSRPGP